MTVTYTSDVVTSRLLSNFLRLLIRWHGSIYKLVWVDLIIFTILYLIVFAAYHLLLAFGKQSVFEAMVSYCNIHVNIIPLSFVLGFFVDLVMKRWWQQYITIPWPDSIAILISAHIQGYDDRARAMRRTIMRYVCLCQLIIFTMISPRVKKRFPTYDQIIEAGLLLENEKAIIEPLDKAFPNYPKHWMPIVWAASIVMRARHENKIRDDYAVKSIIDALNSFRGMCGFLLYYDWVTIPLVYTQVVTLATYAYFLSALFARQWVVSKNNKDNWFNQYLPIMSFLQFFFYMGWLKVAESLINPFGDDDDDFEVNWMVDRNLTVSYLIVDEMHQEHPELIKDQYWDDVFPNEMPYTNLSTRLNVPEASTNRIFTGSIAAERKLLMHKMIGSQKVEKPLLSRTHSSTSELERHSAFKLVASRTELARSPKFDVPPTDSTALLLLGTQEPPPSRSMNFEELMAERDRERRERIRNRYIHMRNHSRTAGYTITILRAPSPKASSHAQNKLETVEEVNEEVVEEEQEVEQTNLEQEPLLKDKQPKK